MRDLLFVAVLFVAASLLAHCGGSVDAPPSVDGASPAMRCEPIVSNGAAPFCTADGVTCSCPDCYVADAGEGTCKP